MPTEDNDTRPDAQPRPLTPEAAKWAADTLLSLEAGNAGPAPEMWAEMRAMGLEYPDYIRDYRRAVEQIDSHLVVLRERLGDFTETTPREIEQMAPRACLAVALSMLTAAKLDAQNARAERDRAERGTPPNELRAIVACVEVVLYGDACGDAPCEDDECNACRSSDRVDAYFRPAGLTVTVTEGVSQPEQTYTLRSFDVREHMWDLDGDPDDDDGESSRDSEPDR